MTKFSDFIRAPGTAGPPTRQGIEDLGFVTDQDIPGILGKYVRVDAAQTFTSLEKTQGRANVDAQQFSTSLTSLAGLTTAADQLAYSTGADTWAVTAITAFGRSLIDDASATAARTTLGLGSIATQAANSVAITGGSITGITDIAVADGGTGASNAANARTNLGLVIGTDVQAQDAQLAAVAALTGVNGSFIRWTGAATAVMQAIIGTVSQSGGVPTGAIIEVGSNANGEYTKFADGTMICWSSELAFANVSTASGSIFISPTVTWTFPATFVITTSPPVISANDTGNVLVGTSCRLSGATAAEIRLWAATSVGTARTARAVATGRWF